MKVVVKQVVKDEEQVLEITKCEFAEVAAKECTAFIAEGLGDEKDGLDFETRMMMSLTFAEFSSRLLHRLFDTNPAEDEDEAKG